jgi:plastocyanin
VDGDEELISLAQKLQWASEMLRFCLILVVFLTQQGFSGTITGLVRAKGRPETEQDKDGKYDSRKFKFAEKVNYDELRDFVVYIDQPRAEKSATPPPTRDIVTQKDATFSPHVLAIPVGTTVKWPNQDDIFHNAFSISDTKQFDLGLYKKGDKAEPQTFDKVGRVDVFCSIHKDMHCIILVLESPHFAATDNKNHYSITNVPAGTYRLKAWHERLPSVAKEVVVPAEGEVKVDFVLGFSGAK